MTGEFNFLARRVKYRRCLVFKVFGMSFLPELNQIERPRGDNEDEN